MCREKSGSDSFGHANVIVVGPIPADNTNSGKSSVSRGKHLKGLKFLHGCVLEGYIIII